MLDIGEGLFSVRLEGLLYAQPGVAALISM
jgi:hypothetical protein